MNVKEKNEAMEKMIPLILKEVEQARKANQTAVITGTRHTLDLPGRTIEMAYYRAGKEHAPLIVGFHGGGFLFGGSALDDELWRQVVDILEVNVASIDYRMSPEVMDHACLDDAYDSILYLKAHSSEYGFDGDHISVFGSSAGGNLAAACALLAVQRGDVTLDNQILMYPFLDGFTDPDTKGEGSFSGMMPHIMNKLHFSPELADDPLLSPVFAPQEMLKGAANAIVSYCEYDNLRPEAVTYCQKLKEAHVATSEYYAAQMPHGYIEMGFKNHLSGIEVQMLGEHAKELIESGILRRTSLETLDFVKEHMVMPS